MLSPRSLLVKFADVKNLPVPILMEIDSALRRQSLLLEYAKKAVALSSASAGGLMARRAAVVLDKPDAYFSRMLPSLIDGGSGLGNLSVLERVHGLFPMESWAVLAALAEYTGSPNMTVEELYGAAKALPLRMTLGDPPCPRITFGSSSFFQRLTASEEATFNVEKVCNRLLRAVEQVGLGSVPGWNALWKAALTKSLRWKAAGGVTRPSLDDIMDMLGDYSLSEATI